MFLYFFSYHVRLLLKVGALSIKCRKHYIFRKSGAAIIAIFLKHAKFVRGGALSIKCNTILYFSKERRGAYFCPSYIEGSVLSSINNLNSICRFGQFVLHLSVLLHLWSIFITFVVN